MPINAYIGIPILNPDNTLFGTLCAIDPESQDPMIASDLALVKLQASLVSSLVHQQLQLQESLRLREKAEAEAERDVLTGLYNRRGWERFVTVEETRCHRYGYKAGVIVVDLDHLKQINDSEGHDAGDRLLRQTAQAIQTAVRDQDIVARLGGDEFGVLLIDCNAEETQKVVQRIRQNFVQDKIGASLGCAVRSPHTTLLDTFKQADTQMYADKVQRKHSYC